ncbi:hypothetical protein IEO21_01064 [Rhodonia placenta]|uniref:RING-type domain-containing protein n=1 Tax=Rhodonia placenta TaxID=104341 RepID=A0A8H7PAE9_9APHY|nr:hypothetical protein IEO21_01064 [Postia placenta]
MPTSFLGIPPSSRRSTASTRQRENRSAQITQAVSHRRRKSRSPDARALEEVAIARNDSGHRKKKRPHLQSSATAPVELHSGISDDAAPERGRKAKGKHRAQSYFVEQGESLVLRELARPSAGSMRGKRKDRSKSRELPPLPSKSPTPELQELAEDISEYSGADFLRMKLELENLRKQLSVSKKTVLKQSKVIDELRRDLSHSTKAQKDNESEIKKLKDLTKKSDEIVANVETNLTCQICMDLLSRPHGLSPCGHVLCQGCLQEWFRSAPPNDEDMHDDFPDDVLYRKKTCPCCRTAVRSRPIPIFLVKSLASAIEKAKASPSAPPRATPPPEDDPWAGIFLEHDSEEDWSGEESDDDYDDDDGWSFYGYGTPDDEESYEGPYAHPQWAPPTVNVSPADFPFLDSLDGDDLAMLRRGATLQMIDLFSMRYTHESGLQAVVDNANVIFLGWNIELHEGDEMGEQFMEWITGDIFERPERWEIMEDMNGSWTAWRLVPQDEVEEYDTSDSEAWAADMDEDVDM